MSWVAASSPYARTSLGDELQTAMRNDHPPMPTTDKPHSRHTAIQRDHHRIAEAADTMQAATAGRHHKNDHTIDHQREMCDLRQHSRLASQITTSYSQPTVGSHRIARPRRRHV